METKRFIGLLDDQAIQKAIAAAEKKSSGEIRVYISHQERADGLAFARRRFLKLVMHRTRERNAVLIYIAPRSQQFAVIGDEGIDKHCGEQFWLSVVEKMRSRFQSGQFTEAVIEAIQTTGNRLAEFFPRQPDDRNELPDTVIRD